jgi:putative endonuclease
MDDNRTVGTAGEEIAVRVLREAGCRIIERNFVFGRGEIDIIAQDGAELVFVEVKLRRTDRFGPPEDAVTPGKRRQLRRIAEGYLYVRRIHGRPCRFDVIAIMQTGDRTEIRHFRNAF